MLRKISPNWFTAGAIICLLLLIIPEYLRDQTQSHGVQTQTTSTILINTTSVPPTKDETIQRLLLISDKGLLRRPITLAEAQQIVDRMATLSAMLQNNPNDSALPTAFKDFDSLIYKLTGMSWDELERVKVPW